MGGYTIDDKWIQEGDKIYPIGTAKIDISNGLTSYYTTTVEQLTDGSFETWATTGYTPDDFDVQAMGGTAIERSTDSYAGTYAALLTCDNSFGGYISDILINTSGIAVGDETFQLRLYAKRGTGTGSVAYIYNCEDGEDRYNYNFTGANAGTWTIEGEGPSADQIDILTITSSYTQVTGTQVTIPSGYTAGKCLIVGSSANSGDTVLIDNVELLVNGVDAVTNGTFENWTGIEGPESWVTGEKYYQSGDHSSFEKEESIGYDGNALKIILKNNSGPYASQIIYGLPNESIDISGYAKEAEDRDTTIRLFLFDSDDELVWNFDNDEWDNIDAVGFDSSDPNSKYYASLSLSTSWEEGTAEASFPETGGVNVEFLVNGEQDNNIYLDHVTINDIESVFVGTDYLPLSNIGADIDASLTLSPYTINKNNYAGIAVDYSNVGHIDANEDLIISVYSGTNLICSNTSNDLLVGETSTYTCNSPIYSSTGNYVISASLDYTGRDTDLTNNIDSKTLTVTLASTGGPGPSGEIYGCTDPVATNYNSHATKDNGSCIYVEEPVTGCMDPIAENYNPAADLADNSLCVYIWGCTALDALNYNSKATKDDGSCTYDEIEIVLGCTDSKAENYNPEANQNDGSCIYSVDKNTPVDLDKTQQEGTTKIKLLDENVCIPGTMVEVTGPDGLVEYYALDEECNLVFIPDKDGTYIAEIVLPDGTKIIKQFKASVKSKAGVFSNSKSTTTTVAVLGGIVLLSLIGLIVYKFFIKSSGNKVRDLRDV